MKKQAFLTKNDAQTKRLAGKILKEILANKANKSAVTLALEGELGAGKTTFTQGLAKALGVKEKITSPTFVIQKRFKICDLRFKNKFENFYHIDCYRLNKPEELLELGFGEIMKNHKNIIVIEWAEKIKSLLPKNTAWIKFEWLNKNERKIILEI